MVYGKDRPKQGMLRKHGMAEDIKLVFDKLDYINLKSI
jgi:hypothetical protein